MYLIFFMKKIITGFSIWSIIGLSGYLVYLFFQDYNWLFLLTAILAPILLMFLTSPYYKTNIITMILIGVFGYGAYIMSYSVSFLALSCLIYTILFKLVRIFGNLNSQDYFDHYSRLQRGSDLIILGQLINSTTLFEYEDGSKVNYEDFKTLFEVQGHSKYVRELVDSLIETYAKDFYNTDLTKEKLQELYIFAIYYSYPNIAVKNKDGILSVGTQYILNILNNLDLYNAIEGEKFEEDRTIKAIQKMIYNSEKIHGQINEEDITEEIIKFNRYKS